MMNKKKTNGAGHIKYALFAIPAFALLLAGNISCSSEASTPCRKHFMLFGSIEER